MSHYFFSSCSHILLFPYSFLKDGRIDFVVRRQAAAVFPRSTNVLSNLPPTHSKALHVALEESVGLMLGSVPRWLLRVHLKNVLFSLPTWS